MLKSLLKSLLILAVFVPFATALPVAALWLCRTPDGAQFLFWTGPWSCCFWVLIYSQLSAAPWRQGRDAVHRRFSSNRLDRDRKARRMPPKRSRPMRSMHGWYRRSAVNRNGVYS